MSGTRILFLDIDGVLNSRRFYTARAAERELTDCFHMKPFSDEQLDPEAVARLERVHLATGCKFVISSAWRKIMTPGAIARDLMRAGLRTGARHVIDKTPTIFEKYSRGKEICQWLREYEERARADTWHRMRIASHAIIDDDFDAGMGPNAARFVRTTFEDGMLDEHADKLIELLMENA